MAKEVKNAALKVEGTSSPSAAPETVSREEYDKLLDKLKKLEEKNDPGKIKEESDKLMDEKVSVKLAYGTDDVFVCVNGHSILIKRGERVEIPKAFAMVLENAAEQNEAARRLIDELSSKSEF